MVGLSDFLWNLQVPSSGPTLSISLHLSCHTFNRAKSSLDSSVTLCLRLCCLFFFFSSSSTSKGIFSLSMCWCLFVYQLLLVAILLSFDTQPPISNPFLYSKFFTDQLHCIVPALLVHSVSCLDYYKVVSHNAWCTCPDAWGTQVSSVPWYHKSSSV